MSFYTAIARACAAGIPLATAQTTFWLKTFYSYPDSISVQNSHETTSTT